MARSVPKALLIAAIVCAAACSSSKPLPPPPKQRFLERIATLEFANGLHAAAVVAMPPGFAPIADRPPLWLRGGSELGVIGVQNGHNFMYGLSGPGWKNGRILAADSGPAAVEPGTIVDLAASPDGLTLASAVAAPDGNHLDIIVRDLIASGPGRPIAGFDGNFDSVSMAWLNPATLAVALRRHPAPPSSEPAAPSGDETHTAPWQPPADGLQLIVVTGASSVLPLKLGCPMSRLSWSRHGAYAAGQGDAGAPPIIIDRKKSACTPFHVKRPIRVLDWDPANEGSFLYVVPDSAGRTIGLYKYDIPTGKERLMGVSTAAAAFTSGGSIMVLGNQNISFRLAAEQPDRPVLAQAAIAAPDHSEVDIKSLGFDSTPAMLANSSMVYSGASDRAAMQVFAPSRPVPWRKIAEYSKSSGTAYVIAQGPARGTVTMSWSPKGRWLAIVDGGSAKRTDLAVIAPPR